MTITSTNFTDISYVEETVPGQTPATPAFQLLPTTGGTPMGNISTAVSEAIRSDRQIDDLVIVDADINGPVNYELSYEPFKPMIEALCQSAAVVVAISATDISADSIGDTFDSTTTNFVTEGIVVGNYVRVAGFTEAANNGIFKVLSVAAGSIGVDGTLTTEAAGDTVTMNASTIRNGAATPKSFTFLKRVLGIATPAYFYYRGCQVAEMNFNFETGTILAGSFQVVGFTEDVTESGIAGQSFVPVPAYSLMNSVSSIASIDLGGLPATTKFSNLNIAVNNNVNAAKAIGTLGAVDLASFTLDVTADLSIYFEDITLYNLYKNATSFSAALVLVDGLGNNIIVYLPKCKFESLDSPIDGKDNFFMLNGSLRALRDDTTNMTFQFTHIAA